VIIGGGVSGLTCGITLLRDGWKNVQIWAKDFTPETTSDIAAGLWEPAPTIGLSAEGILIPQINRVAFEKLQSLLNEKNAGVVKYPAIYLSRRPISPEELPDWAKKNLYGFRMAKKDELPPNFAAGICFNAMVADTRFFIKYLFKEYQKLGGKTMKIEIKSISDVVDKTNANLIINCSGLGAESLVPDPNMYPGRGQVIKINAPFIKTVYILENNEEFAYIIPRNGDCVLGGTFQPYDRKTEPDSYTNTHILKKCTEIVPQIEKCEIISYNVGFRPCRHGGLRLEPESVTSKLGKTVTVIHNYGHGGAGIFLSWGCADFVKKLANEIILTKAKL